MRKFLLSLAAFIIGVSAFGLVVSQSSVYEFFLPDRATAVLGLSLMIALPLVIMLGYMKGFFAVVTEFLGGIIAVAALVGFAFPTYFGTFYSYANQADLFTALAVGLAYLLAGLETPHTSIAEQLAASYHVHWQPGRHLRLWEARFKVWASAHRLAQHSH